MRLGFCRCGVHAAVVDAPGRRFRMAEVDLGTLRSHEMLVRIVACGICHTDASIRDSPTRAPKPAVLGHEGAGIVEAVGDAVTGFRPGSHVVLSFDSCGVCRPCRKGRPSYCVHGNSLNFGASRRDGSSAIAEQGRRVGGHFFGQSAFSTYAVVSERSAVGVADHLPLALLAPLGCGVQTGAGAVFNSLMVREGQSLAVFGTGSVGLSAIMAAKVAGAGAIIAVDRNESRLRLARELGATECLDARSADLAPAILRASDGGLDHALDTTGLPAVILSAIGCLGQGGVCGTVGMPHEPVSLNAGLLMARGASLRGIVQGDSDPRQMIPRLIELFEVGLFPFDRLLSDYVFDDINTAMDDMMGGAVIKPVLRMPA